MKKVKGINKFFLIPGYSYYGIDKDGNIKNLKTGVIRKQQTNRKGYKIVTIREKTVAVHRLMALTFFKNLKLTVNHKNGVKTDNRIENLEIMSLLDNIRHSFKKGLTNKKIICKECEKIFVGFHKRIYCNKCRKIVKDRLNDFHNSRRKRISKIRAWAVVDDLNKIKDYRSFPNLPLIFYRKWEAKIFKYNNKIVPCTITLDRTKPLHLSTSIGKARKEGKCPQ
jgi:hypothetical protein